MDKTVAVEIESGFENCKVVVERGLAKKVGRLLYKSYWLFLFNSTKSDHKRSKINCLGLGRQSMILATQRHDSIRFGGIFLYFVWAIKRHELCKLTYGIHILVMNGQK
jgi:hypothetical protein